MNTFQKIIAGICIVAIPFFNACKNNDPDPCNYAEETQDELQAVIDASNAYGANPNPTTCNAYKSAFQDYLNALEDHDNCVPAGQEDEYHQSINQAQAELDALQC